MTFSDIYTRILPLWPPSISIADAIIIEPRSQPRKNQLLMPNTHNSFFSQKLSTAWTKVREAAAKEDNFGQLMVWTMYEQLNRHAQQLFADGVTELKPAELNKTELEERFFRNMEEEEMTEELEKYMRGTE